MHSMNMSKSDCATQTYFTNGKKHDQVKHVGLCISASTRRLEPDELYRHAQQQLRSAELLHRRKQHDQVKHPAPCISAWTRRLKTHVLGHPHQQKLRIANLRHQRKRQKVTAQRRPTSQNGKKHDQVKHLGLCISDWTRRLKSDEV